MTIAIALAAALAIMSLANAWVFTKLIEHNRSLTAAMLQANGRYDAAQRMAPPPPPPTKKEAQATIEMQKEIIESGGVFSAENPWGNKKPLGV